MTLRWLTTRLLSINFSDVSHLSRERRSFKSSSEADGSPKEDEEQRKMPWSLLVKAVTEKLTGHGRKRRRSRKVSGAKPG